MWRSSEGLIFLNNSVEYQLSDLIDVIDEVLESGGEFRLSPKGTSMRPLIRQGVDSVVLCRNKEDGAKVKDIAFYRRDSGAYVLHRVMKKEKDGTFVMCGDNQTDLEKGIRRDQIIGYVSKIYRGEREISITSFWYRVYLFFWCFIPFRRAERALIRLLVSIKRILKGEKKG